VATDPPGGDRLPQHSVERAVVAVLLDVGQEVGHARLRRQVEQLVHRRATQVGRHQQRPVPRSRQRAPQAGGHRALALPLQGAGDEQQVRTRVGRQREPDGGAEGLVALLLEGRGQVPASPAAAHERHGSEHREVEHPAPLAGVGDPGREPVPGEYQQDAHEQRGEERDEPVEPGPRRGRLVRRQRALGELQVGAGVGLGDVEFGEGLLDLLLDGDWLVGHLLQLGEPAAQGVVLLLDLSTVPVEEGTGDRVRAGGGLHRVVRGGRHVEQVRVRVGARFDRIRQDRGRVAREPVGRLGEDVGGHEQALDRRQLSALHVDVDRLTRCTGEPFDDARGSGVPGGEEQRDHDRGGGAQQRHTEDQPATASEGVDRPAQLDGFLPERTASGGCLPLDMASCRGHGDQLLLILLTLAAPGRGSPARRRRPRRSRRPCARR
jgi:hypothetical protein